MGYYPDIPVSLHGWELVNVEHVEKMAENYYEVTYKRERSMDHNVDAEITITAGLLGWVAEAIPSILRPVDPPPSETKEPELLTEDTNG